MTHVEHAAAGSGGGRWQPMTVPPRSPVPAAVLSLVTTHWVCIGMRPFNPMTSNASAGTLPPGLEPGPRQ